MYKVSITVGLEKDKDGKEVTDVSAIDSTTKTISDITGGVTMVTGVGAYIMKSTGVLVLEDVITFHTYTDDYTVVVWLKHKVATKLKASLNQESVLVEVNETNMELI